MSNIVKIKIPSWTLWMIIAACKTISMQIIKNTQPSGKKVYIVFLCYKLYLMSYIEVLNEVQYTTVAGRGGEAFKSARCQMDWLIHAMFRSLI